MGANISTVEEKTAYGAHPPITTSHTLFPPNNTYRGDNRNNNPNLNNVSSNILKNEKLQTSSLTPNYPKPSTNNNIEITHKVRRSNVLLPSPNYPSKSRRVIYFRSSQSFQGYLEASKVSNTLIVIDFTNGWCGCCRYMEPALHEFAAKFTNVEFLKVDIDELYDISREYGVQKSPTFFLMRKGKLLDKVVGANKEELKNKIQIHY